MTSDKKPARANVTPPNAGAGRTAGTPNKVTARLKDAILLAAEQVGEDKKGKGGLTGYLRFLAAKEPKSFSTLLGKVLPLRLTGPTGSGPVLANSATSMSDDQLAAIASGAAAYEQAQTDDDSDATNP